MKQIISLYNTTPVDICFSTKPVPTDSHHYIKTGVVIAGSNLIWDPAVLLC